MSTVSSPLTLLENLPNLYFVGKTQLAEQLDASPLALVLFIGLVNPRPESFDVAVVVRELARQYPLTVAVVAQDEAPLMAQFDVIVVPSLLWVVRGQVVNKLTRIRDWSDYAAITRDCVAQLTTVA